MMRHFFIFFMALFFIDAVRLSASNPEPTNDFKVLRIKETINGQMVRLTVVPANLPSCPLDRPSQVYAAVQLPNLPFVTPYNINEGHRKTLSNTFHGIISCPLLMRMAGQTYVRCLPESILSQLNSEKILPENVTVAVVAQDLPFIEKQQLCFRPNAALDPTALEIQKGYSKVYHIRAGIFESEGGRIKLHKQALNSLSNYEVSTHSADDGKNVFSPNNLHLGGVSCDNPGSFYTVTSYSEGKHRKGFVCFHMLMNDQQTIDLRSALGKLTVNVIEQDIFHAVRSSLVEVLQAASCCQSFQKFRGLQVITDLLIKSAPANMPLLDNLPRLRIHAETYMHANADLRALLPAQADSSLIKNLAVDHYLQYGYKENRVLNLPDDFDPLVYIALNGDLLAHVNQHKLDPKAFGVYHYNVHGRIENRTYRPSK